MTAKYSPTMLRALRALHAPSDLDPEGVKGAYWTNANTGAALIARGAMVNLTSSRQGITREGAEAVGIDFDATIERAHERALIDNANFRRCPLVDESCDFVAFGHPATPFGNYRDITSDDQIAYHVNQAHIPMGNALFIPSIAHLTDEHRANAADFVEAYRKAKAHDARTGVGTGTSEARCRQAKRNHTLVYVEGAEGRIDDVAVLGGVKFHVTGVNLDGWYYPNQITVYDGRIQDIEAAREAAHAEYFDWTGEHPQGRIMTGTPALISETPSLFPGQPPVRSYADGSQEYGPYTSATASQNRDHAERGANTDYVVDIPVNGAQQCGHTHLHGPHVWSWLGPQPTWYCPGTQTVDTRIEDPAKAWDAAFVDYFDREGWTAQAQDRVMVQRWTTATPLLLPQLHGPVADRNGSPLVAVAPLVFRASLDSRWTVGAYPALEVA